MNISFRSAVAQELANSPWHITVTDTSNYVGIALANGRIGILPSMKPFKVSSIILNNVFDKGSEQGVSRMLKGLNFANIDITIDGVKIDETNISNWKQVLNLKEASLTTTFDFMKKAKISYTIYALRGMPYAGNMEVNIKSLEDISLKVAGKILCPAEYKNPVNTFKILKDLENRMPLLQTTSESPFGKYTLASTASFIFKEKCPDLHHNIISEYDNELTFDKKLGKGESYSFGWAGAVCTTRNFDDPLSESARMVIFIMLGNEDVVIAKHKKLWSTLWEGDIEIEGDIQSQHDVRLALYNLYSFSDANTNLSIPPMGLSSQGYNGHVFWDTELWMYPPLLVLNQDIALSLLNYRSDRLEKAKQKASYFGYKGAMFPWESDDTGEEACPVWALTGTFQHHITSDVGIAFWNYYRITHDKQWLKEKGYPLLKEVADFWVSRATKNDDGSYSINNVIGANEFAQNIDDNAFTNGSALSALKYTTQAAKELNIIPNPIWLEVAKKIKFYYFPDGVMKENSTYNGETIKQADVNLLAYPLQVVQDKEQIIKDLEYYEQKISEDGPAMGYSVLSVLHSRLGNKKKAFELFKQAYIPNMRPPFGALSESAFSNNPYFATGAGGMLQAVIFGFGGLHITDKGVVQEEPCLPKQWKSLTIKGVGPDKKTFYITN
ncbi:MAG: glycoside hydrolase family 65 protein [Bacteroidales bacterium]|nr:glycoside hydrolase family 65 protein [Bacteroidales bacterium]